MPRLVTTHNKRKYFGIHLNQKLDEIPTLSMIYDGTKAMHFYRCVDKNVCILLSMLTAKALSVRIFYL